MPDNDGAACCRDTRRRAVFFFVTPQAAPPPPSPPARRSSTIRSANGGQRARALRGDAAAVLPPADIPVGAAFADVRAATRPSSRRRAAPRAGPIRAAGSGEYAPGGTERAGMPRRCTVDERAGRNRQREKARAHRTAASRPAPLRSAPSHSHATPPPLCESSEFGTAYAAARPAPPRQAARLPGGSAQVAAFSAAAEFRLPRRRNAVAARDTRNAQYRKQRREMPFHPPQRPGRARATRGRVAFRREEGQPPASVYRRSHATEKTRRAKVDRREDRRY